MRFDSRGLPTSTVGTCLNSQVFGIGGKTALVVIE